MLLYEFEKRLKSHLECEFMKTFLRAKLKLAPDKKSDMGLTIYNNVSENHRFHLCLQSLYLQTHESNLTKNEGAFLFISVFIISIPITCHTGKKGIL